MIRTLTCIFSYIVIVISQYAVTDKEIGNSTIKLALQYIGKDDYYVKEKSKTIKKLQFLLKSHTYLDFSFKIYDPLTPRFEVPQGGIFPSDTVANFTYQLAYSDIIFNYTQSPFTFKISRKSTNLTIFDSNASQLIYSEYFIQIGTFTTSETIFGFSERFSKNFKIKPGKWTMFPRDRGQQMDYGYGKQTHGYYPIYMERDPLKHYHINYFRSSNALDVIVDQQPNKYKLTYKVIGGIIDFRFFLGMVNPESLISYYYRSYYGKSAVPPFWSLGFHQCRWGYKNVQALERVLTQYKIHGIPLDTIWTDIDYMKDYETFTIDEDRFPLDRMADIISQYHYIPIIEPSIRLGKGYAYEQGKKRNVFIKDAEGNDQIGKVWAGEVVFTDYFHPNSTKYWIDMLQSLYNKVKFSGVWLDMNEISNLCNGPCTTPTKQGIDYTNDIPYHPGNDTIETQAIPLNATHYGGLTQANVHTFFGFMETYATYFFLFNKRMPFIITRSNTIGSNRYGFHWTGDNYANYQYLRTSISSNFMFGFWGIHMVGSDICGFGGNVTDQLCARWFQLGSLYPFARNHNQIDAIDQEPFALGQLTLKSSFRNIKLRYSILKSYYREFIVRKGETGIFKPLFLQFLDDEEVFKDEVIQTQFLIGDYLMSAPVLQQNKTTRQVYFPKTNIWPNWYDFHQYKLFTQGSRHIITNAPSDLVPLFIKQGYLLFTQNVQNVTKSSQLDNNFRLFGAFAYNNVWSNTTYQLYQAFGGLLSLKNYTNQTAVQECIRLSCDYQISAKYHVYSPSHKALQLNVHHTGGSELTDQLFINEVTIYTVDGELSIKLSKRVSINISTVTTTIDLLSGVSLVQQ